MARDGLIRKIGFNKVKERAAEKYNIPIDVFNSILGTRNGLKNI
jgi:hypothetical protein